MPLSNRMAVCALLAMIPLQVMADSNADRIKTQFETIYPAMKIQSVLPTPIPGLYEVFTNGNILYIDKSGKYVLAGATLVEDTTQRNLTEERRNELNAQYPHALSEINTTK